MYRETKTLLFALPRLIRAAVSGSTRAARGARAFLRAHPRAVLLLILVAALGLRIAGSFLPGYGFDLSVNQQWARSAVELGLTQSYKQQLDGGFPLEYPPVSLFIFAGTGHLYRLLVTEEFDYDSMALRIFIKIPAILADLLIALLLFGVVRSWKRDPWPGVLAAAVYAVHPAAIYDSAVWGQTDAIYTLFLLAALAAWAARRRALGVIALALGLFTKIHAVILLPIFALMAIRKPVSFLRPTVIGMVTCLVVLIPFIAGGSLQEVANVYLRAMGRYPTISFGAYNFWWSLLADKAWEWQDDRMLLGIITYRDAGSLLFVAAVCAILFACRRPIVRGATGGLFHAAALLSAAFFLFLPEMHERYMFPFVALGVPAIFINGRTAVSYWVASLAFFGNLLGVLPLSRIDRALYGEFAILDAFFASAIVWAFAFFLLEAFLLYRPFGSATLRQRAVREPPLHIKV